MDFLRYAGLKRRLVRIRGGFLSAFGLVFLTAGAVPLVPPGALPPWFPPDRRCSGFGTGAADLGES